MTMTTSAAKGRETVPKIERKASLIGRSGRRRRHASGFSIIELLVAIIIIGILVAVLLPLVSRRTEQARIARAQSDLQNLSESMERVAVDTGYYVRLFALNDRLRGDGVAFTRDNNPVDRADGLTDYLIANPHYNFVDDQGLFIDPSTGLYASGSRQNIILRLVSSESRYDRGVTWHGPYLNWQSDENFYNGTDARDGVPDDPWGNNYLFFTPQGMIREPEGDIVLSTDVDETNGGMEASGSFETEVFDRSTILSLGANGLPGLGTPTPGVEFGKGDDLIHQLGQ